ncbi:MAG: hypothetical protein PVJ52_02270 [Candidatus Woesebacteria bacterium]|jgi:hypothetical protein
MQKGQSLFEVIFTLAISAIILTSVVALTSTSVRNTTFSRNRSLAVSYSLQATGWLREERDSNWLNLTSHISMSPTWCLDQLGWLNSGACSSSEYITGSDNLIRELTLAYANAEETLIRAEVTVEWQDAQGVHIHEVISYYSNWAVVDFD